MKRLLDTNVEIPQEAQELYDKLKHLIIEIWENDDGYAISTQTERRTGLSLPPAEIHCKTILECLVNLETLHNGEQQ